MTILALVWMYIEGRGARESTFGQSCFLHILVCDSNASNVSDFPILVRPFFFLGYSTVQWTYFHGMFLVNFIVVEILWDQLGLA